MRTHHCPNCEFIFLGEQPPDECPDCGSGWPRPGEALDQLTGIAVPDVEASAPAETEQRPPSRLKPLLLGILIGGVIGWVASLPSAFETARSERDAIVNLRDQITQTEQQLATVRAELQMERAAAKQARADLSYTAQQYDATRRELESLQVQHRTATAELAQAHSRYDELAAEMLLLRRAASQSFVRDWQLLGPLPHPDDSLIAGAPRPIRLNATHKGPKGEVTWQPYNSTEDRIHLDRFFDYREKAACYAVSWVHSDGDRDVQLSIGSDDGVCVWINGEQVHENRTNRSAGPNQDRVNARLHRGWNEILVGVDNMGSGDWALYFEFRTPDSEPLKLYSTQTPPTDSD